MKFKSNILCAIFLAIAHFSNAQALPKHWNLSDDDKVLNQGGIKVTGLYNEDKIVQINLIFAEANYWTLLTSNYASKKDLMAKMVVDGVTYDSVGIRFKGQTSYGGGPGGGGGATSQKKSFNVSLDAFKKNPDKVKGYQTLNLNNSFQDASFMREVFYFHSIRPYAYSANCNFVHLYINGQDWGLYQNTQQLNGEFLKERFLSNNGTSWRADVPPGTVGGGGGAQWGDGKAALNFLGEDTTLYQKNYTLNGNKTSKSWSNLVQMTKILNQTPLVDLENTLSQYMDIDRTLWHLASEIAFSDDDSYVYKGKMDYYVYQDAETGRFVPMEYDGNSVCLPNAVTWSPFYNETKVNYPLMNRLFAVKSLRQRYIAHMKTIMDEQFDANKSAALLNKYYNQIDSIVFKDPKKATTYAQFKPGVETLKKFVNDRRNSILNNAEFKAYAPPSIASADFYTNNEKDKNPTATEEVVIKAKVTAASGVNEVKLYFGTGLFGNFTTNAMLDNGTNGDETAKDGIFTSKIPAQKAGDWVRYYVSATAANAANSVSYLPVGAEHSIFVYQVQSKANLLGDVVINEVLASNNKTVKDENDQSEDYIELYNRSNKSVDISNYVLTDNPANLTKWKFAAGTVLAANSYFIVWADEDSKDKTNHCNFKLSASGETLWLLNDKGILQDSVTFGVQITDKSLSRIPNGTGNFVIKDPTFNISNELKVSNQDPIISPSAMRLVPNPANDFVQIILEGDSQQPILIFNSFGAMVENITFQNNIRVETTQYSSGIYFVKCGKWLQKLVITK